MILARHRLTLISIVFVTLFFCLSFRSFAAYLTPNLNSDHAVHILMTYDLKLPQDLYYWGQDRLGSLLPILAHQLLKISSIEPVKAASYTQYFLILVGYLSLSSLFKSTIAKLIFALAWFLPLNYFIELLMIAQPYGPQFACIGVAAVLINRAGKTSDRKNIKTAILIGLATLLLFVSLWLSDLSILILLILFGVGCKFIYDRAIAASFELDNQFLKTLIAVDRHKFQPLIPPIVASGIAALIGFAFVTYAKQSAANHRNYGTFSNLQQIWEVVSQLTLSLFRTLTFQTDNLFLSIHALLVLGFVAYLTYSIRCQRQQSSYSAPSFWVYVFAINAAISFILILLSRWLYINGISLRYFTVVYVSCWIVALLLVEGLQKPAKNLALMLLALIAISSSLTLPNYVFSLTKAQPVIEQLQEFRSFKRAGFVGEYWRSYILCTVNPEDLDCTPHDRRNKNQTSCPATPAKPVIRGVRCVRCARKTLRAKNLYLVKENWFDTFPAEIQQFGRCLVKVGEPRQVAGYTIAPYQVRQPAAAQPNAS